MSDGWSSYKYIQENGFNHLVVDILAIIVTNYNGGGGPTPFLYMVTRFLNVHTVQKCTKMYKIFFFPV